MKFIIHTLSSLILISFVSVSAQAQSPKIQLQLLNKSPDGQKWMVRGTGLNSGDILNVGTSCRLQVEKVKGDRAIVLTKDCPIRDKAKKGQRFSAGHTPAGGGVGDLIVTEADDSSAPSQATPATSPQGPSGKLVDGFRIGARVGTVTGEFETPGGTASVEFSRSFGAALGYGSVPSSGMGFLIEGVYDMYSEGSAVRGEGVGTYAFSPRLYGLAGLIGNYLIPEQEGAEGNFGYGFKGGAGFALTKSILIEASYLYMHHQWTLTGALEGDVNMNLTGLELGINFAF